jgi:hypothetical protein
MKKDALTSLKKPSPKAKRKDMVKKKCGKEDINFYKGSSGTLILYTVLV